LVIITLYVPATVAVVIASVDEPEIPGPFHEYVTGSELERVTPIVTSEFIHVIELVTALTDAWGTSVDERTATVDDTIQPETG
jgi:hypothetical protein